MGIASKKELRTLGSLVVVVLVFEFLFGGITVQLKTAFSDAQWNQVAATTTTACSNSSFGNLPGSITIPHTICKNPKATTCGVISLGAAGNINTVCSAGCCKASGHTAAPGLNVTGSSLINGLLSNVAMQFVNQAISSLFGGGGGAGGSYDGGAGGFNNPADEETYLKFNTDGLGQEVEIDTFDLIFGTDGTTKEKTAPLTYGTNDDTGDSDNTTSNGGNNEETQDPDSVTTSYESRPGVTKVTATGDVAPIPGEEGFEQDFFGSTLSSADDTNYGTGLSLTDLEQGAIEAQRREALLYEQQGAEYAEGIEDYRSSNIAQSKTPVEVNPLSNSRYDDLEYAATSDTEATWWQILILRIGQLLGLTQ